MKVTGKILEWGNSYGIRLNKAAVLSAGLRPNESVEVDIKQKFATGNDLWGKFHTDEPTEKILTEIDAMFEED